MKLSDLTFIFGFNFSFIMLDFITKLKILESYLTKPHENYADKFKDDIIMFFDEDFTINNQQLDFLNDIGDESAIVHWVDKLLSRFIMKFDGEFESESDFIYDYLRNEQEI